MLRVYVPRIRLSASRDTCNTERRGGGQSKQTKPLGLRYCVFIFCYENTNQRFCFVLFFLSDGRNELPELQSSSIIRPDDQRGPLSTENFKTNNNKQFEKPAEPPGAGLYLPPSNPLTTLGVSRWRVSYLYLFISSFTKPSVMEANLHSLLASVNGKKKNRVY